MSNDHIVELPKAFWGLKIAQTVLAVLILCFSAYEVYGIYVNASSFAIFTSIYSIGISVYYFVSLHASTQLYNWIALLVLECVAVIFWLSTWSTLVAWREVLFVYYYEVATAYYALLLVSIVFSVVVFILYCVTLVFLGIGVHRHRMAHKPLNYNNASMWNTGNAAEKNEMRNMHNAPAPMSAPYEQQYGGASPASDFAKNPTQANAHEVQGSNGF